MRVWRFSVSLRFLYTQYLKSKRIWFLSKCKLSLRLKKPNKALWGVRGSRLKEGIKKLVSSLHKPTAIRHSQKKWIGVSMKFLHRLQRGVSENPRWTSLELRKRVLWDTLNWKIRVHASTVARCGRVYILSHIKSGPKSLSKYFCEVGLIEILSMYIS